MAHEHNTNTFGELFRTYRLRAGIETLAMFANLMAEKGLVYENSLFSRWQRNERIPRERKIIITTLAIFAARGGITTAEEANEFLNSVDQRELTADELTYLCLSNTSKTTRHIENPHDHSVHTQLQKHSIIRFLFNNKVSHVILVLFAIQSALFFYTWMHNLYDTIEAYTIGWTYCFIPLTGIIYSMNKIKKNTQLSPKVLTTIMYLCYGLIAQLIGLQIWFYYNLSGVAVPYPSIADFGYFGVIPCYIFVSLNIANPDWMNKISLFVKKRGLMIFFPTLFTVSSMLALFKYGMGIDIGSNMATIMDIAFPVGETIPMTILIYALVFKMQHASRFERTSAIAILIGFFLQFTAEYTFIFSARLNIYVNTGLIDFIYCVSYTYMALVIVALTNANTAFAKNFVAVGKTVRSKQSQPLPMSRRLAHVEPTQ